MDDLRRMLEALPLGSLAESLRVLANDARLDAMPAKFRYVMLEAAQRLEQIIDTED